MRPELATLPTDTSLLFLTAPFWGSFVEQIAEFEDRPLADFVREIFAEETQLHLARFGPNDYRAALATQLTIRDGRRIGVLHWAAGSHMRLWFGLLPEVERYLAQHLRCTAVAGTPRKGWSRLLRRAGYALAPHPDNPKLVIAEKELMS